MDRFDARAARGRGKRIVICLDGTWNKVKQPDEVTNVVKFAQSVVPVAEGGVHQIVYYNSGVGTGGPIDRLLGGVLGVGVRSNVHRAYAFLTLNYQPGDEIFVLGFSRGAFTARAVVAMIGLVGILRREEFERFEEAWRYYRTPPDERRNRPQAHGAGGPGEASGQKPPAAEPPEKAWFHAPVSVRALGVWDTVGSYGIPSGLAISGLGVAMAAKNLGFHDRQLGKCVEHAYHAVAIDEARGAFQPTLWLQRKGESRANVEQVWFAGVHSDVGGGYPVSGLSDAALVWMMDRMTHAGLELDPRFIGDEFCPCPRCDLHKSDSIIWRVLPRYQRPVLSQRERLVEQGVEQEVINEKVHWSVVERRKADIAYTGKCPSRWKPANLPGEIDPKHVSEPGPFELAVLGGLRPHPKYKQPYRHDTCWRETVPKDFAAPAAEQPAAPETV